MSTSLAHCSHQSRTDTPCRMTRSRSVSIVMRMVLFVAKLGSICSSAGHFRDTFPATFWLVSWPRLNANASCSESGLNVLKNRLISFELLLGVAMDRQAKHLLEFGPFRMDLDERVLMRDRETITLSPKAFETLLVLVQHSERVVLKDDLMKTCGRIPSWKSPTSVSTSFSSGKPWETRPTIRNTSSRYRGEVTASPCRSRKSRNRTAI